MNRTNADRGVEAICAAGYTEQQWADFALGTADGRTAAEMAAHRAACPVCMAHYAAWRELLSDMPANLRSREAHAAAGDAIGGAAERAAAPAYPSERRRRSLERAVRAAGRRRKWTRPTVLLGAGGLAAAALLVFLLVRTVEPADPVGRYIVRHEPNATAVMEAPDTTRFRVVRMYGLPGEGFVWLSGDAGEALLYLDGLPELEAADYQAWAVRGGLSDSLGLMKLEGGKAHLHVRSALLRGAETISLSAEPKGGSLQPSSAPTALVLYEAGR